MSPCFLFIMAVHVQWGYSFTWEVTGSVYKRDKPAACFYSNSYWNIEMQVHVNLYHESRVWSIVNKTDCYFFFFKIIIILCSWRISCKIRFQTNTKKRWRMETDTDTLIWQILTKCLLPLVGVCWGNVNGPLFILLTTRWSQCTLRWKRFE